jgi:hypothetical protein
MTHETDNLDPFAHGGRNTAPSTADTPIARVDPIEARIEAERAECRRKMNKNELDFIDAEQRLAEASQTWHDACCDADSAEDDPSDGPLYNAKWDQYDLISYTAPRSLADCAVKFRVLRGPMGLEMNYGYADEASLEQIHEFIEQAVAKGGER